MAIMSDCYVLSCVAIVLIFSSCKEGTYTKPLKYTTDEGVLSCDAYFEENRMVKVMCYDKNRNLILVDNYLNDKLNDTSYTYFPHGQYKVIGRYYSGLRMGLWQEFYSTGVRKSVSIHDTLNGEHFTVYKKVYDTNGELDSAMYSLEISSDPDHDVAVNEVVNLDIRLRYSEYDSVYLIALLNYDSTNQVYLDTTYSKSNKLRIPFAFDEPGNYIVEGILIETNKGEYGGERSFSYEFIVK